MSMDAFIQLFKEAKHTVMFTGAGMSTESGLPDFRSKERGLWEKFNPDELANVNALIHNRDEFTAFYQARLSQIDHYKPHEGHAYLAKFEVFEKIDGIITQNVDGFHEDAGSENVLELHGSFNDLHCHTCNKQYSREYYLEGDGYCECGGTIRPGIVLFGEMLPEKTFKKAEQLAVQADLFVVLGSSLSVSPANTFPLIAKQNGAKLVIINQEPTEFDTFADVVIHDKSVKEALSILEDAID